MDIQRKEESASVGRLLDAVEGQEDVIRRYRQIEKLFRQLQVSAWCEYILASAHLCKFVKVRLIYANEERCQETTRGPCRLNKLSNLG